MRLQAPIETAAGLDRVSEIAGSSARLDSLILGYADLAASLGRTSAGAEDPERWPPEQQALLTAARSAWAAGDRRSLLRVNVDEQFRASATRAPDLGFDGKWAIHPTQVQPLNELFTPTADEIEWARERHHCPRARGAGERSRGGGARRRDARRGDPGRRAARARAIPGLVRDPDDGVDLHVAPIGNAVTPIVTRAGGASAKNAP